MSTLDVLYEKIQRVYNRKWNFWGYREYQIRQILNAYQSIKAYFFNLSFSSIPQLMSSLPVLTKLLLNYIYFKIIQCLIFFKKNFILLPQNIFLYIATLFGFNYPSFIYRKRVNREPALDRFKLNAFHLMGNKKYYGSHLNGTMRSKASEHLILQLKQFLVLNTSKEADQLTKIISILEQYKYFSREAEKIAMLNYDGLYNDSSAQTRLVYFTKMVYEHIFALNRNESLLIPAGYQAKETGHAICYELKRMNNHSFKITLFNTGSGAQPDRENASRYIIIPEALLNHDWLRLVFKPLFQLQDSTETGIQYMTAPFQHFMRAGYDVKRGQPIMIQINGTCAESCLLAWLKTQLHEQTYTHIVNYLVQTAVHYMKHTTPSLIRVLSATRDQTSLTGYHLIYELIENGRKLVNPEILITLKFPSCASTCVHHTHLFFAQQAKVLKRGIDPVLVDNAKAIRLNNDQKPT